MRHAPTGLLICLEAPETIRDLATILRITGVMNNIEQTVMLIVMEGYPILRVWHDALRSQSLYAEPNTLDATLSKELRGLALEYLALLDLHPSRAKLGEPSALRLFLYSHQHELGVHLHNPLPLGNMEEESIYNTNSGLLKML